MVHLEHSTITETHVSVGLMNVDGGGYFFRLAASFLTPLLLESVDALFGGDLGFIRDVSFEGAMFSSLSEKSPAMALCLVTALGIAEGSGTESAPSAIRFNGASFIMISSSTGSLGKIFCKGFVTRVFAANEAF